MGNNQAHNSHPVEAEAPVEDEKPIDEAIDVSKLPEIIEAILSGDPKQEFIACQMARKLAGDEAAVDSIVQSGILQKCIQLLKSSNNETQHEVAWLISNMTSKDCHVNVMANVKHVIELGAVDLLIPFLRPAHPHPEVVKMAVEALANIAAVDDATSKLVSKAGVVPHLITLAMSPTSSAALLHYVTSMLADFCCWDELPPPKRTLKQILPALVHLINLDHTAYTAVLSEAARGFAGLTEEKEGRIERIEQVQNAGVTPRLIQILVTADLQSNSEIVNQCLITIQNMIVGGTNAQKNRVLAAGPLIQAMSRILESSNLKNAAWAANIIWNIVVGPLEHFNAVIDGGLIPILIKVIQNCCDKPDPEANVAVAAVPASQAAGTLKSIVEAGEDEHVTLMYQNGVIPAICGLLKLKGSEKAVTRALLTLEEILESVDDDEEKAQEYRDAVENCGGVDSLEQLEIDHDQNLDKYDNDEIYRLASRIMDHFFEEDEPLEGDATAPKVPRLE